MKFGKIGFLIFMLSLMAACSTKEMPPKNYPDFSTPEATFETSAYAIDNKDFSVYLDSLTPEYQLKYGKTRQEQITSLESDSKNIKPGQRFSRTIIKVEYGGGKGYDAGIYFSVKRGSRIEIVKSWVPFKKIDGKWKRVFLE
jgi:hypothetical protein